MRETDIACQDCKVKLWIGKGDVVFVDETETRNALARFLVLHRGHQLVFELGDAAIFDDEAAWQEVTPKNAYRKWQASFVGDGNRYWWIKSGSLA